MKPWMKLALPLLLLFVAAQPLLAAGSWTSLGPFGGIVTQVVMDPEDPRTAYALSGRFVFKSVNAGETWEKLPNAPEAHAVAVAPSRRTTLYAAGGSGIHKSLDGGRTWAVTRTPVRGFGPVRTLVVDPRNPDTVYAATERGVFKTSNGGTRWALKKAGLPALSPVRTLTADAVQPDVLYASVYFTGIFRSADGGNSWTLVHREAPGSGGVSALAAHAGTVYAGLGSGGVLKSTDNGKTWSPTGPGLPEGTVTSLIIHPQVPRLLFAGVAGAQEGGVYRSANGGRFWTASNAGLTNPQVYSLAVDRRTSAMYAGTGGGELGASFTGPKNPGGVFFRQDSTGIWRHGVRGIASLESRAVAVEPGNPQVLWAGLGSLGLFRSGDRGASWTMMDLGTPGLEKVFSIVPDPRSPGTVNALALVQTGNGGTAFDFFRTTDSGRTWSHTVLPSTGGPGPDRLILDPRTGTLFALGWGVLRSADNGATWAPVQGGIASTLPFDVALDPFSPSVLYASSASERVSGISIPEYRFYKSTDGGLSWREEDGGFDTPRGFLRIVALPTIPTTLIGVGGLTVYRSQDGGESWQEVAVATLPTIVSDLVLGPNGRLYGAVLSGEVFSSPDGVTWTQLNGPAPTGIRDLDVGSDGTVYAGTHAAGVQALKP